VIILIASGTHSLLCTTESSSSSLLFPCRSIGKGSTRNVTYIAWLAIITIDINIILRLKLILIFGSTVCSSNPVTKPIKNHSITSSRT